MSFKDAQQYVGMLCEVSWQDRRGEIQTQNLFIADVTFVPLYGVCLVTDYGEIRLDRVVGVKLLEQQEKAA